MGIYAAKAVPRQSTATSLPLIHARTAAGCSRHVSEFVVRGDTAHGSRTHASSPELMSGASPCCSIGRYMPQKAALLAVRLATIASAAARSGGAGSRLRLTSSNKSLCVLRRWETPPAVRASTGGCVCVDHVGPGTCMLCSPHAEPAAWVAANAHRRPFNHGHSKNWARRCLMWLTAVWGRGARHGRDNALIRPQDEHQRRRLQAQCHDRQWAASVVPGMRLEKVLHVRRGSLHEVQDSPQGLTCSADRGA